MLKIKNVFTHFAGFALILIGGAGPVLAAGWKTLPGHVPKIVAGLVAQGELPATNRLRLAIGLPLRDEVGLDRFLAQLYDPASPQFHKFLTPAEFTARFGPTETDYALVKDFALSNGLTITGTSGNRLLLDVSGPVAQINRAFHVTLRTYRHPAGKQIFFAPDSEPTVALTLPVADVSGLNDYILPQPKIRRQKITAKTVRKAGSASGGNYFGNDFRAAYVPGTTLTGAGQSVGLFEFDGFYASDIAGYAVAAGGGRTNIPIQTVLIDGFNGIPTSPDNDSEVSLDIEMAMAMAPGLARIVVFEGNLQNDILNAMATNSSIKNLSCSWGWGGGPSTTTDAYFKTLAAQGQSFFDASGDDDAFTAGASSVNGVDNTSLANAPSSSPYITQVGGTELSTTGPSGAWSGESVWNDGDGSGSSGGVSSYYAIPAWQTNVSMTVNGGSSVYRNIPDVAMVADYVWVYYNQGDQDAFEGTSCAAPLWAGFMALVNQQAAASGFSPIGLLNPAIYTLGTGILKNATYANYLNDITSGNNEWSGSPSHYVATTGYDLCTGWGTPRGTNLITALVNLNSAPVLLPTNNFSAVGVTGGLFLPASQTFTLTNAGGAGFTWKIAHVPAWLMIAPSNGTLAGFGTTNLIFNFTTNAAKLTVGSYTTNIWFTNVTGFTTQMFPAALQIVTAMQINPAITNFANGSYGGPFAQNFSTYTISNASPFNFNWSLINTSAWLTASPTNGTVTANATAGVTLGFSPAADLLTAKNYATTLRFTNLTSHLFMVVTSTLSIGQNILVNGGFETGSFAGWTLVGSSSNLVSKSSQFVHSGSYGAALGQEGSLATLSQTLLTSAGQEYLLSFWLKNLTNRPTQQFEVNWNASLISNLVNPPVFGWTNFNYFVTATGTNTVLQFAAENDHSFFGLDDVTLKPVPAIAFASVLPLTNSWKFTWNTATGLVYQFEYKTNLLQTNWLSLGSAVTAKTNTLTITDTNALILSPQRFYRLGVSP